MENEHKEARKRNLRVRASVTIGHRAAEIRTHDISVQGVSLLLPFPAQAGASARISFSLFHDGKLKPLSVTGKAAHCTLSEDAFRTGFAFTSLDPEQKKIIQAFCNER